MQPKFINYIWLQSYPKFIISWVSYLFSSLFLALFMLSPTIFLITDIIIITSFIEAEDLMYVFSCQTSNTIYQNVTSWYDKWTSVLLIHLQLQQNVEKLIKISWWNIYFLCISIYYFLNTAVDIWPKCISSFNFALLCLKL